MAKKLAFTAGIPAVFHLFVCNFPAADVSLMNKGTNYELRKEMAFPGYVHKLFN